MLFDLAELYRQLELNVKLLSDACSRLSESEFEFVGKELVAAIVKRIDGELFKSSLFIDTPRFKAIFGDIKSRTEMINVILREIDDKVKEHDIDVNTVAEGSLDIYRYVNEIMENTEIVETLEKLNKLSYEGLRNELENYPIETLELLAVNIYEKESIKLRKSELLEHILYERRSKLNKNFEWTNENQKKLLNVNDKFMQTFELAYNEALSIACELENRMKNNDRFVKDYEIDIKITPYMDEQFYDDDANGSIGYVLSEPLSGFEPVKYSFGHEHYNSEIKEKPIYLDKSFNSNREYFGNIFKDEYICYGIHQLLENDWSFNDIINIKRIWADVDVAHQHFIENILKN